MTQQWTSANVPWNTDYLDVTFNFTLSKQSPVVLVLSQPDSRFFSGLQGRHRFRLHFRLYKNGEETYIVRSILQTGSGRSCSAELDLEPGDYFVHVKIDASRYDGDSTAEEVIKKFRFNRRDKLLAVGKNFDLPNSKGRLRERENKNAADDKATTRKEKKDDMKRDRIGNKKERDLKKARERRIEAEIKRKEEIKKAEKKKEKEAKEAKKAAEKAEKAKNKKEVDGKASKEKSADPPGSKDDKDTVGSAEAEMKEERHHGTSADTIVTPPKTEGSISSESTPQATPDTDKSSEQAESKTADEKATDEKAHEERTTVEIVVKSDGDVEVSEKKEERAEDEEEEEDDDEDDVSDVSSVIDDDFDWDSDIDAPADVDTEDEDEPGMYASDPWNAVCVIGLRVYSMDKDTRIHVKDDVKIT